MRSLAFPLALLALLILPRPALSLSSEEKEFLAGFQSLLQVSSDPCHIAPRLEARYKLMLRGAGPEQDSADVLDAVDGRPGLPLRLGEGFRMAGAFALYDDETRAIYLDSAAFVSAGCPDDAYIARVASITVGPYVHEVCHHIARRALGGDLVATAEDELLAYAREARFLAGLKGWPPKRVQLDAEFSEAMAEQLRNKRTLLGWVEDLRSREPDEENLKKLAEYVDMLEQNRKLIEKISAVPPASSPLEISLVQMVEAWKSGWGRFLEHMFQETHTRPSLALRKENLGTARRYLADSRAWVKAEPRGTLARQLAERAVGLGKQDVRFWGDEKQAARALEYYERKLGEARAPASPSGQNPALSTDGQK
jgi:hypothetical protein